MRLVGIALGLVMLAAPAQAGTVNAAVAANFTKVVEQLGADFKAATGHDVVFSFGATGALSGDANGDCAGNCAPAARPIPVRARRTSSRAGRDSIAP